MLCLERSDGCVWREATVTQSRKRGNGMGRFLGKDRRASRKEPDYIGTLGHDGRKYVDFDKFFNNATVQKQLEDLPKAIKAQQRRAGSQQ